MTNTGKTILFDLTATQPSRSSKRHGGGRYGEVVFRRMIDLGYQPFCFYDSTRWLNPDIKDLINNAKLTLYDLQQMSIDEIVASSKAEVIYSALPMKLLEREHLPCQLKYTWHGLRDEETPLDSMFWKYKHYSWREEVRFLLKRYIPSIGNRKKVVKHRKALLNAQVDFVVVSNHTRLSMKSFYPEAKDRNIKVFYAPSTSMERNMTQHYKDKYFMLVSANRWEKNALRGVMALDKLMSMGYLKDFHVRLTGASSETVFSYKIKNKERFHFMGYLEDQELEQLYHDAYCLIYPSLNEGFGYPPLEAMHYGTPVIASPFTSIPEVCQDAVMYFNPFSVEEIMARILAVTEQNTHTEYSHRAQTQYAKVTAKQKQDLDSIIEWIVE